jgi:fatty acid-binding protein DegV
MLKIVPVIKLEKGKLIKSGKGRVFEKTILKTYKKMLSQINQDEFEIFINTAINEEADKDFEKMLMKNPTLKREYLSSVITIHTGPNAIGFIISRKKNK